MDAMRQNSKPNQFKQSSSSLRQLVSGFDNKSTFLPARTTHEEFEAEQLIPATEFTVLRFITQLRI